MFGLQNVIAAFLHKCVSPVGHGLICPGRASAVGWEGREGGAGGGGRGAGGEGEEGGSGVLQHELEG